MHVIIYIGNFFYNKLLVSSAPCITIGCPGNDTSSPRSTSVPPLTSQEPISTENGTAIISTTLSILCLIRDSNCCIYMYLSIALIYLQSFAMLELAVLNGTISTFALVITTLVRRVLEVTADV